MPEDSVPPVQKAIPEAERIKVLVAEDDVMPRELIVARLEKWGFQPIVTTNGYEAMGILSKPDSPRLAILDWMMPGMDGIEVCRKIRESDARVYVILLTNRSAKEDVVQALHAGADDYVIKPFEANELHARIQVGLRIVGLQSALQRRIAELEAISAENRDLKNRLDLPI